MKASTTSFFATTLLATLLALPSLALACDGMQKNAVTTVGIEDAQKTHASFVDANNAKTRTNNGVIPGAILLTSFDNYSVDKELPKDKTAKLVFYCANEHCTASTVAAEKAIGAGYSNVAVLPAGIQGWKKAGLKTQAMTEASRSNGQS